MYVNTNISFFQFLVQGFETEKSLSSLDLRFWESDIFLLLLSQGKLTFMEKAC